MRGLKPLALVLLLATSGAQNTHAQTAAGSIPPSRARPDAVRFATNLETAISEAARRFDMPTAWIRAVIRAESGFDPRAVSSAGALGLMQLMPATYAEMRLRHGLGADPFAVRDNILAGAAYLREMHDRFGEAGLWAAYNAGPGRYREHLADGRPLPAETLAYERRVRRFLSAASSGGPIANPSNAPPSTATAPVDPFASPLFVPRTPSPAIGAPARPVAPPAAASELKPGGGE